MDFMVSQTIINLAKGFAGESQARTRYNIYAEKAKNDHYEYISGLFGQIAANELSHAQVLLKHIKAHAAQPVASIQIDTGYPYTFGDTQANLLASAFAEEEESTSIYPLFADIAHQEEFTDIEQTFSMLAKVEASHNKFFKALHEQMLSKNLYKSDIPVIWKCSICGYTQTGKEPWTVCPLCGHAQGFTEIKVII